VHTCARGTLNVTVALFPEITTFGFTVIAQLATGAQSVGHDTAVSHASHRRVLVTGFSTPQRLQFESGGAVAVEQYSVSEPPLQIRVPE
jgi:hypothetical protein